MVKQIIKRSLAIAILLVMGMSSVALAGAVSQGFKAKEALPTGAVVSLVKSSNDTVEKATLDSETLLVGVIAANGSLLDLQPAGSEVRVAVSGDTNVLVTNLNGDIKSGDQLVISPLGGVAMRFSQDETNKKIVATAGQAFNKASTGAKQLEVNRNNGQKQTVAIGQISAKLVLSDRTNDAQPHKHNILDSITQKVAGKPVSPLKLVAATVISLSAFILAGLILNGSVKGSFISLGRNPLSKNSIMSTLIKSALLALIIVAMALGLAYAILVV